MAENKKKIIELLILSFMTAVTYLLWNTVVIYPVKLLVVILHEISHGIAAVLSGGYIVEIAINERLGGHCISSGGNQMFIASAGYLGSLLWGSALFVSGYNKKWNLGFSIFLGSVLIFITANYMENIFAGMIISSFGLYFIIAPRYLPGMLHGYITKFLGITSAFYVAIDIGQDLVVNTYLGSDASLLSSLTGVPAVIWGIIWLLISIIVILKLFQYGIQKGYSKNI